MKINYIKKYVAVAAVAFLGLACTANYLEINSDPYAVTDEEMQRDGYAIRSSLTGIANGVISPDVNTTQFTECLLGGAMSGYMADGNDWATTISNFNPTDNWTNVFMSSDKIIPVIYTNYNMLKQVTDDPVVLAVGDIIKVAAMHRVTDTYGPIPYSQIGQNGSIQVPYDSQEDVYKKMFEELTNAVNVLTPNRTNNFSATADVVYGGVTEKWIKFANSLKLRLAMRISYAAPELSKQMAEEAVSHEVGVFASNEDNANFSTFNVDGNPIKVACEYNYVSTHDDGTSCTTRSGDSKAAADIICYMNGYEDPRREAYFTKCEWDGLDFAGLRRGIVIPKNTETGHKFSGVNISVTTAPVCWMNAAEVAFLKAEAVAVFNYNMGGTAQEFYEQGIKLSFEQWGAGDAADYIADNTKKPSGYVDPSGSNSYDGVLSTMTVAWDEAAAPEQKQEKIMIQKWIANWLLGNEAWADYRRTGYPNLLPATAEGNKSNGIVDSEAGPRRMPYPASEAVNNAANYQTAVSTLLKGADNMATKLWFDCK